MLLCFLIHDGIHATVETTKMKRNTKVGATIFWDLQSDETNNNYWDDVYIAFHSFVLRRVVLMLVLRRALSQNALNNNYY